jgi:hypothetical protein
VNSNWFNGTYINKVLILQSIGYVQRLIVDVTVLNNIHNILTNAIHFTLQLVVQSLYNVLDGFTVNRQLQKIPKLLKPPHGKSGSIRLHHVTDIQSGDSPANLGLHKCTMPCVLWYMVAPRMHTGDCDWESAMCSHENITNYRYTTG